MIILKTILLENNLENGLSLLTQREQEVISLYYLEALKDVDESVTNTGERVKKALKILGK